MNELSTGFSCWTVDVVYLVGIFPILNVTYATFVPMFGLFLKSGLIKFMAKNKVSDVQIEGKGKKQPNVTVLRVQDVYGAAQLQPIHARGTSLFCCNNQFCFSQIIRLGSFQWLSQVNERHWFPNEISMPV